MTGGNGRHHAVVLLGANALFKPLDKNARPGRYVSHVGRITPHDHRFTILGYPELPPSPVTLDALADEAAEALAEVADHPVPLIGISFGGFVAQRIAVRHPHLISQLILLASAHRFSSNGWVMMREQCAALRSGDFETLLRKNARLFRRRWFNTLVGLKLWASRGRLSKDFKDPSLILRTYEGVFEDGGTRNSSFGSPISAPTLIIGGSADQYFDSDCFAETAALLPGSQLRLFHGETHMLPMERSRAVVREINRFVSEQRSATSACVEKVQLSAGV